MKTTALFLSVIMLFSMLAFTVNAADSDVQQSAETATITFNGTQRLFNVGDKLLYTVKLQNDVVINNGQFDVLYPSSILSIKSFSIPKIDPTTLAYNNKVNKGIFVFNFSDIDKGGDFTEEDVLIEVKFVVTAAGEGELSFLKETASSVNSNYEMKEAKNVVLTDTLVFDTTSDQDESEAASSESTTSESATSESATSESGTSEAATSESATSESGTSEAATSESSTSESGTSEAASSESATSESGTSEAATSESSTSESGTSEAATSESATSESSTSEVASSESATSESTTSEAASSESATSESTTSESATSESSTSESSASESGSSETAPTIKTNISLWKVKNLKNKAYTGKAITQTVQVTNGSETATFDARYIDNIKVGTATIIITGTGKYTGTIVKYFKITKAKNPMTVKAATKTVKKSKLAKKKITVKALTVKNAKGKVSYEKLSGSKKITVNKKNGKLTVKKGTKKGKYKVKIRVTANGNSSYKSLFKNKTVTIKVK